ncbi:MAG: DUF3467 domain-containing protein [Thermodesulfobacteriota bacterium]|jgi:hypothetical protein
MATQPKKKQKPGTEIRRREDFSSVYANNCYLEPSPFDLKLIFGILDQQGGKPAIEQHTQVNLSWPEAKLVSFLLQFQIAAHEIENGKIKIPSRAFPPEPPPIPKELESDPLVKKFREIFIKMREDFIAGLQQ